MIQKISLDYMKELLITASKKKKEVNREKFIAVLCCDYGVTRRNVVEKLNLLIAADYVIVSKNELKEDVLTWQEQ